MRARPARLTSAQADPHDSHVIRGLPLSPTITDGWVPPVSSVLYLAPRLRQPPGRRWGLPGDNWLLQQVRLDPVSGLACSRWSQRVPKLPGDGSGDRKHLGAKPRVPRAIRERWEERGSTRGLPWTCWGAGKQRWNTRTVWPQWRFHGGACGRSRGRTGVVGARDD